MDREDPTARLESSAKVTSQNLASQAIAAGDELMAVLGALNAVSDQDDWARFHHGRMVEAGRNFVLTLASASSLGVVAKGETRGAWERYKILCAWRFIDLLVSPAPAGTERQAASDAAQSFMATWPSLRAGLTSVTSGPDTPILLIDSNLSRHGSGVWKLFDHIITGLPGGMPEMLVEAALATPSGRPVAVAIKGQISRHTVSRSNALLRTIEIRTRIKIPWKLQFSGTGIEPAVYKVPTSDEGLLAILTKRPAK